MATPAGKIKFREPQIEMAHGAGGIASRRLVEGLFAPLLFGSATGPLGDAAHIQLNGTRIAVTTDSFVVKPLRFPGGSIGELAINGTVNDLAVSGARAEAMVVTFVLEAGLPTDVLEAEVRAMALAADQADVRIAGGDTKVVEHGKADNMYITTTGIGRVIPGVSVRPDSVRPGDQVLLSGPIGDHGVTILLARGELDMEAEINPTPAPSFRSSSPWWSPRARAFAGCVTRPGEAWPHRSTNSPATADWRLPCSNKQSPCATRCAALANFWASTRCTLRTKASFSPLSPPSRPIGRSKPCVRRPAAWKRESSAKSASNHLRASS